MVVLLDPAVAVQQGALRGEETGLPCPADDDGNDLLLPVRGRGRGRPLLPPSGGGSQPEHGAHELEPLPEERRPVRRRACPGHRPVQPRAGPRDHHLLHHGQGHRTYLRPAVRPDAPARGTGRPGLRHGHLHRHRPGRGDARRRHLQPHGVLHRALRHRGLGAEMEPAPDPPPERAPPAFARARAQGHRPGRDGGLVRLRLLPRDAVGWPDQPLRRAHGGGLA
mmetsp:Transcript_32900/g.64231  ORF Transcript_32900/g.64231 Transcript_32900/m.64231 type:complete len:223 (+) Transcript_32900:118-786(+)